MDDSSKRKMRRLEAMRQMNGDFDEDEEGFGFGQAQKSLVIDAMREDDDMSEEEINKQLEQKDFYDFKRGYKKLDSNTLARYNSLKNQEKLDDEEIVQFMVDLNQQEKLKKNPTLNADCKNLKRAHTLKDEPKRPHQTLKVIIFSFSNQHLELYDRQEEDHLGPGDPPESQSERGEHYKDRG